MSRADQRWRPRGGRIGRWAVAALVVCLLALAPGLLLLKGVTMLARDRHVRRGSVVYVESEARWAGVGLILWAAAIPAYGWIEWRRGSSAGSGRRGALLALSVFVSLAAAGSACKGVAIIQRNARQAQERAERERELDAVLRKLPPDVREQVREQVRPGR